jgi:uncharacterized RDD family membrane protein YckC
MKCPKCGYLGFEHVERCRNCGYDFALSSPATGSVPELPLRNESQTLNPLVDLSLVDSAMGSRSAATGNPPPDLDRIFGAPAPASESGRGRVTASQTAADGRREELPLFGPPIPDDEPLITRASPPRPPLAVRRATPDANRLRTEVPRTPALDLSLDLEVQPSAPLLVESRRDQEPRESTERERPTDHSPPNLHAKADAMPAQDAGVGARFLAVAIDLLILAVIDVIVIYFTIQICAITVDDLGLLPKGPLIAFLLVQNGGYLVAFTAGGQTLGKMAAGIRVVPNESDATLDLGQAFLRTLMWVVLAVPAGLGFLTALLSRDRRGLHDRFAGTRVVRASA